MEGTRLGWLLLFLMLNSAPGAALAQEPESTSAPSKAMKGAEDDVLELEPIVILGTRGEYDAEASANVTILKKDDVAQSPMLVLDDFLRQIPGFNTFRRSSSLVTAPAQDPEAQGVSLRGIGPGREPCARAGGRHLGQRRLRRMAVLGRSPVENIERVEVVRGANAALWGNFAMGGVITGSGSVGSERTQGARGSSPKELGVHGGQDKIA